MVYLFIYNTWKHTWKKKEKKPNQSYELKLPYQYEKVNIQRLKTCYVDNW